MTLIRGLDLKKQWEKINKCNTLNPSHNKTYKKNNYYVLVISFMLVLSTGHCTDFNSNLLQSLTNVIMVNVF